MVSLIPCLGLHIVTRAIALIPVCQFTPANPKEVTDGRNRVACFNGNHCLIS